uniref:Uncharacterized protein n=1 Tax=Ciona intestinalis TaxID=7719 RepID=H2XYK5_CIOIN
MLVALLVFCSLFTNCYSLGQAKTIPLPAASCSRAPLVEPKDILCDVNSTSLVRCWGDRASFNASKDEWSTVCVFRTPPAVSDISKYQCLVKNDLGPVKCKAKNGSTFLASCLFTVFKCKHNCIGKVLSLYDEGGHCGATDRWCPEDNLYSFTAPLASPGTKHIFSDLQQLHLTPPSYCIPWPTWKIATVAVSV